MSALFISLGTHFSDDPKSYTFGRKVRKDIFQRGLRHDPYNFTGNRILDQNYYK